MAWGGGGSGVLVGAGAAVFVGGGTGVFVGGTGVFVGSVPGCGGGAGDDWNTRIDAVVVTGSSSPAMTSDRTNHGSQPLARRACCTNLEMMNFLAIGRSL